MARDWERLLVLAHETDCCSIACSRRERRATAATTMFRSNQSIILMKRFGQANFMAAEIWQNSCNFQYDIS